MEDSTDETMARHARLLSGQLRSLSERIYPPDARKSLRTFSSPEAARLIGVSDSYLRQLSLEGQGPTPSVGPQGRRAYTLDQVNELRHLLAGRRTSEALTYLPRRRPGERLQTIAVCNFKGGSGKTTSAVHLVHHLAMKGLRVLAVDLDPQASLTSMFGLHPEFDVEENRSLYGAIRYDDGRVPTRQVIQPTYFPGVSLIPGNLELAEFEHDTPKALARGGAAGAFFLRIAAAIREIEADFDVCVMDCPPQLGFLTLGALVAATGLLVTIHPQMLDVASMAQFLLMMADLLSVVREAGAPVRHDFLKYVVTRHEPSDGPQLQVVGLLRALFGDDVLKAVALKSAAIEDAGLTKQTVYEIARGASTSRDTYDRAVESMNAVNAEIFGLVEKAWGRS